MKFQKEMKIFEEELVKRGTKYFFSQDYPGVLDFNLWPWFERLDAFPVAYPDVGATLLPEDIFPRLVRITKSVRAEQVRTGVMLLT